MTRRMERLGSVMRKAIWEILLTEISDPRIEIARTSITRVEVQSDLLAACVKD